MTQTSTNTKLDRVACRITFRVSTPGTTDAKPVHTLVARELPPTSSINGFGEIHGVNSLRVQGGAIFGGVIGASALREIDPRRTMTLGTRVGRMKWVP